MKIIQRILLYVLLPLFMLATLQACANADAGKRDNNGQLIERARDVTLKYKLTAIPLSCLDFKLAEETFGGMPLIVVRERHGGECGGDPDTSPRLYSVAFDESSGEIWSDARSLLGQMEVIGK